MINTSLLSADSLSGTKRWLLVAAVVTYYLAVVLPHVVVGKAINKLFDSYGRDAYNDFIAVVALVGIIIGIGLLYKSIVQHPDRKRIIYCITFSLVAILLCFSVLFVVNIEAIHFVQYALLAVILFPLTKSCRDTMTLCVLLGGMDELYQYLVLDTTAPYFDFNDVLFDTLGAGFGLLFLKIKGQYTAKRSVSQWWKRLEFRLGLSVGLILIVLSLFGLFSVNPTDNGPVFFTLFKKAPTGFWTYPQGPYARLHILTPIPGLILIYLSAYAYGLLDRFKPLVVSD